MPNWLNTALKIAELSAERQKHGCIIVRGGRVLSVGINRYTNSPSSVDEQRFSDGTPCSIHAERAALRNCKDPGGSILYVARQTKTRVAGNSGPCASCRTLIEHAGIKRVYYTTGGPGYGVWRPGTKE